jgi:hypothetical protein
MKNLILTAALLAAPAMADTLTLSPANCGPYRVCSNVPNDGGASVNVGAYYVSPTSKAADLTVTIDGKTYTAKGGNVLPVSSLTAYAADGSYVTVTLAFTYYSRRTGSGHQYYVHGWNLDSGTVVR